jgi:hypothetical protein
MNQWMADRWTQMLGHEQMDTECCGPWVDGYSQVQMCGVCHLPWMGHSSMWLTFLNLSQESLPGAQCSVLTPASCCHLVKSQTLQPWRAWG